MKLALLDPRFLVHHAEGPPEAGLELNANGTRRWLGLPIEHEENGFSVTEYNETTDVTKADLMSFLCPRCLIANSGDTDKTHRIYVSWGFDGSSVDDLTVRPAAVYGAKCGWRGFVIQGEVF